MFAILDIQHHVSTRGLHIKVYLSLPSETPQNLDGGGPVLLTKIIKTTVKTTRPKTWMSKRDAFWKINKINSCNNKQDPYNGKKNPCTDQTPFEKPFWY